jgi:hypothetical protein
MWRNEDAENSSIDEWDDYSGTDFQAICRGLTLRNDRDTVDDDLHQELNLEDIEEENEEEKGRSRDRVSPVLSSKIWQFAYPLWRMSFSQSQHRMPSARFARISPHIM